MCCTTARPYFGTPTLVVEAVHHRFAQFRQHVVYVQLCVPCVLRMRSCTNVQLRFRRLKKTRELSSHVCTSKQMKHAIYYVSAYRHIMLMSLSSVAFVSTTPARRTDCDCTLRSCSFPLPMSTSAQAVPPRRADAGSRILGLHDPAYLPKLVAKRDAATLLPLIRRHVRPITTIESDGWAAYASIPTMADDRGCSLAYTHNVVCHNEEFVTQSGVHVNNVENSWSVSKRTHASRYGTRAQYIQAHLHKSAARWNLCCGSCRRPGVFLACPLQSFSNV